jgi:hypothetical protein
VLLHIGEGRRVQRAVHAHTSSTTALGRASPAHPDLLELPSGSRFHEVYVNVAEFFRMTAEFAPPNPY